LSTGCDCLFNVLTATLTLSNVSPSYSPGEIGEIIRPDEK